MDRDPLLRAGRLDALSARSLQHQERNNLQRFRDQGKIAVEIMIGLVHWPAGHRYSRWIWSKGLLLHQLSSCHTFVERKRAKSSTPDLGLNHYTTKNLDLDLDTDSTSWNEQGDQAKQEPS